MLALPEREEDMDCKAKVIDQYATLIDDAVDDAAGFLKNVLDDRMVEKVATAAERFASKLRQKRPLDRPQTTQPRQAVSAEPRLPRRSSLRTDWSPPGPVSARPRNQRPRLARPTSLPSIHNPSPIGLIN